MTFVRDDDGSSKLVKDVQLSDSVGGMKLFISSQWNGPAEDIAISYVGKFIHILKMNALGGYIAN